MKRNSRGSLLTLSGTDALLHALGRELERKGGSSLLSQLVLRLGAGFDVDAFGKLVHDALLQAPLLHASVSRRFGLGPPVFHVKPSRGAELPHITVHDAHRPPPPGTLPPVFEERMNQRFASHRGDLLRFDLVRYERGVRGTDVAITCARTLFDPWGSEHFACWLDERFRAVRPPGALPTSAPGADPARALRARELGQRTGRWLRHVRELATSHPVSLAGATRGRTHALRSRVLAFDHGTTEQIAARAQAKAGYLAPALFYLAAAIRAHHALFLARGLKPGSFLIPFPIDMRPQEDHQEILRNCMGWIWFEVPAELVENIDALITELRSQLRDRLEHARLDAGRAALHLARFLPGWVLPRVARRVLGGTLGSFWFAYTDELLPGLDHFLGAEIRDVIQVLSVPPSPGSSIVVAPYAGRLNVTHVWSADVLSDADSELFSTRLERELLGL